MGFPNGLWANDEMVENKLFQFNSNKIDFDWKREPAANTAAHKHTEFHNARCF